MFEKNNLCTEKELCAALEVHPKTVYQWRLRGCPFSYSSGRSRYLYDVDAVLNWLSLNGLYHSLKGADIHAC